MQVCLRGLQNLFSPLPLKFLVFCSSITTMCSSWLGSFLYSAKKIAELLVLKMKIWIYRSESNSFIYTEKFTGPNKVLLVLARRTGAYGEDYRIMLWVCQRGILQTKCSLCDGFNSSFHLFNWFQLVSSGNVFWKIAGHCLKRSKIWYFFNL